MEQCIMDTLEINIQSRDTEAAARYDEDWTTNSENLARSWLATATTLSNKHTQCALINKRRHVVTGLPTLIIPTIFAPLTLVLTDKYLSVGGFIATALFSAINSFLNYNQKYQKHLDYAARYADIITDIEYELAKQRKFRISPDVFLTKIRLKLDYLKQNAPDIN